MTIKYRLGIAITFCLLIAGCNTQTALNKQNSLNTEKPACSHTKKTTENRPSVKYAAVEVGFLEVVDTQPAEPAVLPLGEKLNIEVAYDLESLDKAMIWARPYLNSQTAGSYRAHHLIPVDKKDGNPGIVECWFYFDEPAAVDEVRVFMQDLETEQIVRQISYKTNAKWTE